MATDSAPPSRPPQKQKQIRAINAYLTGESVAEAYDDWASDYEPDLVEQGYVAPANVARAASEICADRTILVLDVGCGTGLMGKELAQHGFTRIDGVDISPGMIGLARAAGHYRDLITADLKQRLPLKARTYDLLVSAGTLETGLVEADSLAELVRVTRPGGLLCLCIDKRILTGFDLGTLPVDIVSTRDLDVMWPRVPGDEAYPYQLQIWRRRLSWLDRLLGRP